MLSTEQLLKRIERFLSRTGMKATTFGREAMGDTAFVSRLRMGTREARSATVKKALDYMEAYECQPKPKTKPRPKR